MNREIPKPLRNALARQVVGDVHLSPDLLTSFMERTLAPVETEVVTHHLAQCGECREIVFLASEAAEGEMREERELVAAAAGPMIAVPAHAARARPAAALRPKWRFRLAWAVPIAAAALLVSGVLIVQLSRIGGRQAVASLPVASNRPVLPSTEERPPTAVSAPSMASASPPARQTFAKGAPQGAAAARVKKAPQAVVVGGTVADQYPHAAVVAPASATPSPASAAEIGDMAQAMVPQVPTQNGFVESEAGRAQHQAPAATGFAKSMAGLYSAQVVRPQWRISSDGHLERSTGSDEWTRALGDQPAIFRAVAALGNNVWAGGNGGALFHSSDNGQHWNKVSVAADSNVEAGAIVSIRFADPQHGMVVSDSGTRWTTTDGGVTWATTP